MKNNRLLDSARRIGIALAFGAGCAFIMITMLALAMTGEYLWNM